MWGQRRVYLPKRHHREETKKANNKEEANDPSQGWILDTASHSIAPKAVQPISHFPETGSCYKKLTMDRCTKHATKTSIPKKFAYLTAEHKRGNEIHESDRMYN
ncbi:hypothetical protein QQP08_016723 [Theobroma cacao]|nr:hypothetical protein QQP08_016723 [Theobroma cacao]